MDNLLKQHVWLSISLYKEHTEFYPQTGNAKWKCWATQFTKEKFPYLSKKLTTTIITIIPFYFGMASDTFKMARAHTMLMHWCLYSRKFYYISYFL